VPDHPASFDEVYAAHYADLTVQLYAYFDDRQEAQDVVQEAFCRALARWPAISRYDDPVAWVRRVAWNLAVSRWRRARTAVLHLRRQRPAEPQVAGPSPERVALFAALATLPGPQRRLTSPLTSRVLPCGATSPDSATLDFVVPPGKSEGVDLHLEPEPSAAADGQVAAAFAAYRISS